jgi:thymidylate synthase
MNNLDKQYQALLQDILDNGTEKKDRTGTGTISVFGRQIRHKMSEGFPLLTTKKMAWKVLVTELLWFLRGDTNIKFLVDNGCHIWDGDAFKNFMDKSEGDPDMIWNQDQFVHLIKTDDEFANKWGELGPIYGKQWRSWGRKNITNYDLKNIKGSDQYKIIEAVKNGEDVTKYGVEVTYKNNSVDQIQNLINDLKTNPDSRRLLVSAWNVGEIDQMVLPPCHYGFQVYTRELSKDERMDYWFKNNKPNRDVCDSVDESPEEEQHKYFDGANVPKRAISLMFNMRSCDTFLGLPFNIASYGLLLEIIATSVNMVPDELIGNLGDVHLYSNHIEQAKEQIGRKYTPEERSDLLKAAMGEKDYQDAIDELMPFGGGLSVYYDMYKIPYHTRTPYPLPKLNINTEFWPAESGSCGEGPLDAIAVMNSFKDDNFCKCLLEEDIQLGNYQSHPAIKAPLSN